MSLSAAAASPDVTMTTTEVEAIIKQSVQSVIGESVFRQERLQTWTDNILEECLKNLAQLARPFKFAVTANIGQKAGAGMHIVSANLWDEQTDGSASLQWSNMSTLALVSVFWVKM